jgi:hypothetical protein
MQWLLGTRVATGAGELGGDSALEFLRDQRWGLGRVMDAGSWGRSDGVAIFVEWVGIWILSNFFAGWGKEYALLFLGPFCHWDRCQWRGAKRKQACKSIDLQACFMKKWQRNYIAFHCLM